MTALCWNSVRYEYDGMHVQKMKIYMPSHDCVTVVNSSELLLFMLVKRSVTIQLYVLCWQMGLLYSCRH